MIAARQVRANGRDQIDVAFAGAGQHDDAGAKLFFQLVGDVAQLFGINAVDLAYQNIRAIEGLLFDQQLGNLILLKLTA